jgi:8-oxo-dGTP diphosphatase
MALNYCLGFVVDPSGERVLLMEKRRPSWQAGRLNGIGGKVEGEETGVEAMVRECQEETGLVLPADAWAPMGAIAFEGGQVHVYVATGDVDAAQALTDEPMRPVKLSDAVNGRYPLVDSVQEILTKIYEQTPKNALKSGPRLG